MPTDHQPVACDPAAIPNRERYEALCARLRSAVQGRAELPDGYQYSLRLHTFDLSECGEWMALERLCCPFLTFELSVSGRDAIAWLTLTGPEGTKELLAREFSV